MSNTPPVIPIGLATKLGIGFAIIAEVAAALVVVLEGTDEPTAIALIIAGALAAVRVIDGRMKQASAAIAVHPVQDDLMGLEDDEDLEADVDFGVPPSEEELGEAFPEDAPVDAPEGGVGGKPGMEADR